MKICIVAHNAYRFMSGNSAGHIGGVEFQSSMMARWFAKAGHQTSLVTWTEGNSAANEVIDRVTVIKTCRQDAGLRFVRFFYPRWVSLNIALKSADADVYYQNGAEHVTGQVAHWCCKNRRKFVFSVASDLDCQAERPEYLSLRENVMYRYGLRHADQIIVQTADQQNDLDRNFGYESLVLPMPCDLEPISHATTQETNNVNRHAVLIGRLDREKNIEMFIDIAIQLPEYKFAVIGPDGFDENYVSKLKARASQASNITFLGAMSRQEICSELRSTSLLCCTSHYEGFPNTFLEAWSQGVPVVSTVDPDGILEREKIGTHVLSESEMVTEIRKLLESNIRLASMKEAAESYYENTHYLEPAMQRFSDVLNAVLQN
jgi:glycosyltransferase involved in cell wall biosynthesis